MMRAVQIFLVAALGCMPAITPSHAQSLAADLATHVIDITSGFSGTEILLFGSAEEDGHVLVAISGPKEEIVVRKKRRIGGIWINRESIVFRGVPSFYAVNTSVPLVEMASRETLKELGILPANLPYSVEGEFSQAEQHDFFAGLIRNKEVVLLYRVTEGTISYVRKGLFRTTFRFPANAPTGTYTANIHFFRNGELLETQSSPLFINKSGIERIVFELAHQQPAIYGIVAILLAVAGGWIAAAVFRRT